jgi:hypothetical protein
VPASGQGSETDFFQDSGASRIEVAHGKDDVVDAEQGASSMWSLSTSLAA